jgi:hypothetical protein
MIDDLANDTDDQSVENEYEKVVTMANGRKIVSVKTAEEMAANAAEGKAADETATTATAGQTTSRSKPAARS